MIVSELSNVQPANNGVSAAAGVEEMARINIEKAETPSNLLNFTVDRVEMYYFVATRQEHLFLFNYLRKACKPA